MRSLGLRGTRRAKTPHTTRSAPREQCPADLVDRHFSAFQPNELWVADIPPQAGGTPSYVRTFSGWVYVAFVTDVNSRRIVGWQTTRQPVRTDLALDALNIWVSGSATRTALILLASSTTPTVGCRADSRGGRNTARIGGVVGG